MRPVGLLLSVLCACSGSVAPDAGRGSDPDQRRDARIGDAARDARRDAAPCTLLKPYSTKNAVCNQCAERRCCAEINQCFADPGCDDSYVNCTLACALGKPPDAGVSACLDQCGKDYPGGKTEYELATGCADRQCATECR